MTPGTAALLALALGVPGVLAAQLPSTSLRAVGLGNAYSVSARGFEVPGWNPAGLGMAGQPRFSVGLPRLVLELGSSDFGLGDLRRYASRLLTDADKADILGRIDNALGIRMRVAASPIAVSAGRVAIAVVSAGAVEADMGKDAVELALLGNAARMGIGQYFNADNTRGSGWAATTLAAATGWPVVTRPRLRLSVGLTGKLVFGQALGRGTGLWSRFQVNPHFAADASGEWIFTSYAPGSGVFALGSAPGHGLGLDAGVMLALPGELTLGVTGVNVVAVMTWHRHRLEYRRMTVRTSQDAGGGLVNDTEVDLRLRGSEVDGDSSARAYRDSLLQGAGFTRLIRVAASKQLGALLLTFEGSIRLQDGLDQQLHQYGAAGVEYLLLGHVPLRAGLGLTFANHFIVSGGTGLCLGPLRLDISAANISGTTNPGVRVGAGLGLIF